MSHFLGHFNQTESYSAILKSQSVGITKDRKILFFQEKNDSGYLEYAPDQNGNYQKKLHRRITAPFINQKGKSQNLAVYLEPKELLKARPQIFLEKDLKRGTLGLLEPNREIVHRALANQKHVKKVQIISNRKEKHPIELIHFFDELEDSFKLFSIEVSIESESRAINPFWLEQHQQRNRSIDFFNL